MELLLNLIWLVAVVFIAAAAFSRARSGLGSSPRVWVLAVAVVCLCVVLFPAISMTDDLQQVILGSEESAQNLILSDMHNRIHTSVEVVSLLLILLLLQAMFVRFDFFRRAFVAKSPLDVFFASIISRPPPSVSFLSL